ncbi:hypothetical protein PIB30_091538 [Stylosanthes scabra]|uniref:Uncharacterized protein n=1 Tax=Stylosanthes scabra TaxID=79078 RepID=A0ABU6YWH0_9FABA|nr:hypothetical protein [Stylosanthes scabra]
MAQGRAFTSAKMSFFDFTTPDSDPSSSEIRSTVAASVKDDGHPLRCGMAFLRRRQNRWETSSSMEQFLVYAYVDLSNAVYHPTGSKPGFNEWRDILATADADFLFVPIENNRLRCPPSLNEPPNQDQKGWSTLSAFGLVANGNNRLTGVLFTSKGP